MFTSEANCTNQYACPACGHTGELIASGTMRFEGATVSRKRNGSSLDPSLARASQLVPDTLRCGSCGRTDSISSFIAPD